MYPVLEIGGLSVSTYHLAYLIAGPLGTLLAFHRMLRLHPPARITALFSASIVAGMAGSVILARGMALAAARGSTAVAPDSQRGFTILGFLAFGALAMVLLLRLLHLPIGASCDLMVPGVPLVQAIGRIGCLLGGCCGGRPTTSFLALTLPGRDGGWLPRYPTQLLSGAADLAILAALLCVERRAERRAGLPFAGYLTVLYGLLIFAKRFLIEFLREQTLPPAGPLTWAQIVCLVGIGVAAALLVATWHRERRRRARRAPGRPRSREA